MMRLLRSPHSGINARTQHAAATRRRCVSLTGVVSGILRGAPCAADCEPTLYQALSY